MVLILLILLVAPLWAHPLLNLNSEDWIVYENLEAGEHSPKTSLSIRPYSLLKAFRFTQDRSRVKEYMNALSTPGFFVKPVNSITFSTFYTSEEFFFVENAGGIDLRKGLNLYTFLDGYASLGKRLVVYYQLKYKQSSGIRRVDVHRAYAKLRVWKLSFEVGKDAVRLGPGEFSLLLSPHSEPFPMIKVQTERSLRFLGKWDFVFLRGWLKEKRRDRDDPSILALRVVWKPWDFLELGGTRTSMFGGEGRPEYELWEYPKVIVGTEENIPFGRYDTDGYGAYDVTLYLPLRKLVKSVRVFKFYYQEAGADIWAPWQPEDRGGFVPPFGFVLLNKGYVIGFFLSTDRDIFRLEFDKVGDRWYVHHLYNVEGYTYGGLSLGFPYGRDVAHLFFKHRRYLSRDLSLMYRLGFIRLPLESDRKMERYYLTLSGEKRVKSLILSGFVRLDWTRGYDADPSPVRFNIVDENRNIITAGFSLSWRI